LVFADVGGCANRIASRPVGTIGACYHSIEAATRLHPQWIETPAYYNHLPRPVIPNIGRLDLKITFLPQPTGL